jgi:hypothetical protein
VLVTLFLPNGVLGLAKKVSLSLGRGPGRGSA